MSRLYTRTDLERAARLALTIHLAEPDPNEAIARALRTVTQEGEAMYPRYTVLTIAAKACQIHDDERCSPTEAADRAFEHVVGKGA